MMTQAKSISLSKFTETVQSAVKVAIQKHPKFNMELPPAIEFGYLIRGVPIPDPLVAKVTLAEAEAFANEVAAQIVTVQPEVLPEARIAGTQGHGVVYAAGHHVICGIPPVSDPHLMRQ
jgi:hypothetical protein